MCGAFQSNLKELCMDPNKRPDDMVRITTPELAQAFIDEQIAAIREQIGSKKVLLALSGGVDSSVVAALLIKAIGKQLICVHVNHGLMRKGESEQVVDIFKNQMDANLVYVDATDRFLDKLVDVEEPETKRKIIGAEFIRVFEEEARKVGDEVSFLAQGTIYPDILESQDGVKAHHNVGGLPANWACPKTWLSASPSPAPAWAFAALAPSPATALKHCAMPTLSYARKSTKQGLPSGSTSL